MPVSRSVDRAGLMFGNRYRLQASVGAGASASVYVADDVVLGRKVAVKVLHDGLADDSAFLQRFRAEARAAAALNHPHVMAVYDWGEERLAGPRRVALPYLVTEYLGGGSLRAMLRAEGRLTPAQTLLVGLEAVRALEYAHKRGIVHRDVKPANLLFDEDGRLRIADFGLARALAEAAWSEPTGALLGTVRYASPEQALGRGLDGRSDVYSLALLLLEAVTGQVPFAADTTIGTLMGRIDRPLPVDDDLGPLAAPLRAAGHPDPALRLDAAGFRRALAAVVDDFGDPAPLRLAGADVIDLDIDPDGQTSIHPFGGMAAGGEAPDEVTVFDRRASDRRGDAAEPPPATPSKRARTGRSRRSGKSRAPWAPGVPAAGTGALPPGAPPALRDVTVTVPVGEASGTATTGAAVAASGIGGARPVGVDDAPTGVVPMAGFASFEEPTVRDLSLRDLVAGAPAGAADQGPDVAPVDDDRAIADLDAPAMATGVIPVIPAPSPPWQPAAPDAIAPSLPDPTDPHTAGAGRASGPVAPPRSLVILVVAAVVAGALVGALYWAVAMRVPAFPVPSLTGRDAGEVERLVAGHEWVVQQEMRADDTAPPGRVLGQQPAPGTEVLRGGAILVVVSSGPPLVDIPPDLAGQPLDSVRRILGAAQLQIGRQEQQNSETVAANSVIGLREGTPAQVTKFSAVDLIVSAGPVARIIPEGLVGAKADAALKTLTDLGLKPTREDLNDEKVPEGSVIKLSSAPGQQVPRDSAIVVTVSKGPKLVPVPSVEGKSVTDAAAALSAAGLVVGDVQGIRLLLPVTGTDPAAGTVVRLGTVINLRFVL